MRSLLITALALAIAACGNVEKTNHDAPPPGDADPDAPDASVPPPPPPPGRELAVAAGRITGGAWTIDVHVGSVSAQSTTTGGSWSVRGGSPIQP